MSTESVKSSQGESCEIVNPKCLTKRLWSRTPRPGLGFIILPLCILLLSVFAMEHRTSLVGSTKELHQAQSKLNTQAKVLAEQSNNLQKVARDIQPDIQQIAANTESFAPPYAPIVIPSCEPPEPIAYAPPTVGHPSPADSPPYGDETQPAPQPTPAPAPFIKLPEILVVPHGQPVIMDPTTNGHAVEWIISDPKLVRLPQRFLSTATGLLAFGEDGIYVIYAYTALGNIPSPPSKCVVYVGTTPPVAEPASPTAPVIPPDNEPNTNPFQSAVGNRGPPDDGFRVLIVEESSTRSPSMLRITSSKELREYLNSHCAIGPNGVNRDWRILDPQTPVKDDFPIWQKMMSKPPPEVPWIYAGKKNKGISQKIPTSKQKDSRGREVEVYDLALTMKLLKSIGGE